MSERQSREGPATIGFTLAVAVLVGATTGLTFGAADLLRTGGSPLIRSAGVLAVASWLGAGLAIPLALSIVALQRLSGAEASRARIATLLLSIAFQGLAVVALPRALALVVVPLAWLPFLVGSGAGLPALGRPRTLVLACAGWAALSIGAVHVSGPATPPPAAPRAAPTGDPSPNVVLVVMDTTRADHLGAYGHPGGLTPHLDRLAREGTLYEEVLSPSPWTVPSHASLFTGLFPLTHGATSDHHQWLDDRFVTLAERLTAEGYETLALVANPAVTKSNLGQGFAREIPLYASYEPLKLAWLARRIGLPAGWVDKGAAEAVAFTEAWLEERDARRPFFLFVNLMEAHEPYLPPLPHRRAQLPPGVGLLDATRTGLRFNDGSALSSQLGIRPQPAGADALRALYAGGVAYQDAQLGRLLAALRRGTDFDRTLVIVTADHGENLGEGQRWGHLFAINDQLLRVPLIVRHPARFPAGLRLAGQAQLVDVAPTVLRVVGKTPETDLPGRSLLPEDFGAAPETFSQFAPLYSLLGEVAGATDRGRHLGRLAARMRAVRTQTHKYVWYSNGERMLYDLRTDPDETTDVREAQRSTADDLDRRLARFWEKHPHYAPSLPDGRVAEPLSPAERERLRAMGYLR